jgi:hypothetical protein
MKFARFRLILAAVLFVGWLGWLGYLALGHAKAVVVSRSQLLVATSAVKVEIAIKSAGVDATQNGRTSVPYVEVTESFGPQPVPLGHIIVDNIRDVRLPGGKLLIDLPIGSEGAYVLLLEQTGPKNYMVAGASGGPGSSSGQHYLIYPWSSEVERQVREQLDIENRPR